MNHTRSVLLGCDDAELLASVMRVLQRDMGTVLRLVSASSEGDLIQLTRMLHPDLVILAFDRINQVISNFDFYVSRPDVPLLCLTRTEESEALCWSDKNIVFTSSTKFVEHENYLASRIRSILRLQERSKSEIPTPATPLISADIPEPISADDDRNMSRYVLELDQKRDVLTKVKERIVELFPSVNDPVRNQLSSIVNSIRVSFSDTRMWDDFKAYFEKIDPRFLAALMDQHPDLTSKDIKYCCYLKMNMSNNDIQNLLGINQESVRTHKYRLKKKMALSKEQDLRQYVSNVGRVGVRN